MIAQKFRHHHDDENGKAMPPPISRHWSGRRRLDWPRQRQAQRQARFQCLFSGLKKRFIAAHHQLNENAVVIRNFSVQHTRCRRMTRSVSERAPRFGVQPPGSNADDFVVFNIGCMSEGTQHGGHF